MWSPVGQDTWKPPSFSTHTECSFSQSRPFRKFSFLSPTEDIHHFPQLRRGGHNSFPGFIKYVQEPICSCQRDTEGSLGVLSVQQPPLSLLGRASSPDISVTGRAEGYPSQRAVDSLSQQPLWDHGVREPRPSGMAQTLSHCHRQGLGAGSVWELFHYIG